MTRFAAALAEPPAGLVGGDRRGRILDATLTTVAERGYPATTVTQIAGLAGVSTSDLERCFASKEDCFLAAYDLAVAWIEEWVRADLAGRREDWPQGVGRAVRATAALLDADPRLARLCGAEVLFAGPRALQRHREAVARLSQSLRPGRELSACGDQLPVDLERTLLAGAIVSLGRSPGRSGELAPEITYFLLVPYLDVAEAWRLAGRR